MFYAMTKALCNICGHNKRRIFILDKGSEFDRQLLLDTMAKNKRDMSLAISKMQLGKNKGKIWITNGVCNIRINKTDNIPDGFRRGKTIYDMKAFKQKLKKSHRDQNNYVWVNNEKYNKFVPIGNIPDGFKRGQIVNKKHSLKNLGKIWVTNGTDNKFVQKQNIPDGYFPGRSNMKKLTEETKKKISQKRQGKIVVNNGKIIKYIDKNNIPDGFKIGSLPLNKRYN